MRGSLPWELSQPLETQHSNRGLITGLEPGKHHHFYHPFKTGGNEESLEAVVKGEMYR